MTAVRAKVLGLYFYHQNFSSTL